MADTSDRITKLEVQLEEHGKKLEDIGTKVDALYSVFMQAKGAKYTIWAVLALASLVGAKFWGFLGLAADKLPKP